MGLAIPTLTDVNVGNGRNNFGVDREADKEVNLISRVVAGVAPGARIVVYFTESNERGFADGVTRGGARCRQPPERDRRSPGANRRISGRRRARGDGRGARRRHATGHYGGGAAGDDLATERRGDKRLMWIIRHRVPMCARLRRHRNHAQRARRPPSSMNWCGTPARPAPAAASATNIRCRPIRKGRKAAALRSTTAERGRGVPDVAAAAAETNGYLIFRRKTKSVAGGTSAVAPLWAAFIALLNARRGQNHRLHQSAALAKTPACLRPITSGDNIAVRRRLQRRAGLERLRPGSWRADRSGHHCGRSQAAA